MAVLLGVLSAGPARADEEESPRAAVLVEQAIALIANDAGDERVAERIDDGLQALDKAGVDLALVAQALAVINRAGEQPAATEQARALGWVRARRVKSELWPGNRWRPEVWRRPRPRPVPGQPRR